MLHRRGNYAAAMGMNVEKLDIINSSLAAMLVSEKRIGVRGGVLWYFGNCEVLLLFLFFFLFCFFFFYSPTVFSPLPAQCVALIVRRSIAKYRKIRRWKTDENTRDREKERESKAVARGNRQKLKVVKNSASNRYFHRSSKHGTQRSGARYLCWDIDVGAATKNPLQAQLVIHN